MYSLDFLIEKRKRKWDKNKSITKDREYIESVAGYIIENNLIKELQKAPSKIIELFFYIVDKHKKLTPFFLNNVQKDFVTRIDKAKEDYSNRVITSIKMLVLKGRQQGFTSLITAYQLACTISNKNFEGFTCADEESNARAIFENKAKYPYTLLPSLLRPTEKYNNAKQLLFEKLHSSWEVKTATKNMGRSRTINFWHGSEAAFWKDGISTIQAAIGEALTKDAIVILESTANGYNEYKELWDSGNYINCFYEWWQTDEYRFEFQNEQKKLEFEKLIRQGNKWIHERCQWLLDTIKLDLEQIFWYYNKYENYIDKELIKQEYPCFDEESFLSSGQCIFDTEKLSQRKKQLEKLEPLKVGEFDIEWNYTTDEDGNLVKTTIKKYKWVDKRNGPIVIYKDVKAGYPYAIGGDTAGEGSDHFVGDVIDNTTKEQVAQLRHKYDEDVYAEQMYCLAKYYNQALVGIETNYSTYPVKRLANMYYPRLYMREYEDSITGKLKKSFGFETTKKTRPIVIADLVILVRDHINLINSIETIKEMLTFIKNEKGRAEAEVGKHDDCVMSLGITHYIAAQQTEYVEKETNYNNMYDDDDDDDNYKSDNYFS